MPSKCLVDHVRWISPFRWAVLLTLLPRMIVAQPSAPIAKVHPKALQAFGDTRIDNYHWLRYREDPAVMEYIAAENRYTDAIFAPLQPLVAQVYEEMIGRIQQTDTSAPDPHGGFFYYSRTVEGLQYRILCRKKGSLTAPEQILLDLNEAAKPHKFYSVDFSSPSPDHRLFAFGEDTTGYREHRLRIKDLATGDLLPDTAERIAGLAWSEDKKTLFYVKQQEKTKRRFQIWRHTLGTPGTADQVMYAEDDDRFNVGIAPTLSRKFMVLWVASGESTELRYADASNPEAPFKVLIPRQRGIRSTAVHQGSHFYIRINDTGRDFRVIKVPDTDPTPAQWQEVIAAQPGFFVEDMLAFRKHMAYLLRIDGLHTLRIVDSTSGASHDVAFNEAAYSLAFGENEEFDTATVRFRYSSMVTPLSWFDYDMEKRERTLVKRQEVLGGYDPSQYAVERVMVTSHDGVRVPMTIAFKKGFKKDGSGPVLLYGYGAYAIPSDPSFRTERLSLLDRGFAYAIAHIRGGTDLGYSWYEAGKLLNKLNTFRDFIACAEDLVDKRYTNPKRLALEGHSAGGLLVGAVTTMRPELFRVVFAGVPFVDVVNSLSDTSIPLTTTDADEFGSPLEEKFYHYMKAYSPYDQTRPAAYPNIYLFTGLNDSQVPYWEPLKWTALLRSMNQGSNQIVLRMNTAAGHGGASGRYDRYKELAQSYAFVLSKIMGSERHYPLN